MKQRPEHAPEEIALAVVRVVGQQHVLDVFRLVDQEAVQEQEARVEQVAAEKLRRQDRQLVGPHASDELDEPESRREIGVLDLDVWRGRGGWGLHR